MDVVNENVAVEMQNSNSVEQRTNSATERFSLWMQEPSHQHRLDMPASFAQALIPQRLLEIVENPASVDIVIDESSPTRLAAYIVEHKQEPVTDKAQYEKYIEQKQAKEAQAKANTSGFVIRSPIRKMSPDSFRVENPEVLIEKGLIGFNDLPLVKIELAQGENPEILMSNYYDREEVRGKGIAKDYFQRLHGLANQMGFRFLVGQNYHGNVDFFTKALGRTTLEEVKPELRQTFSQGTDRASLELTTIDFLHNEDKATFIGEPQNL